MSLLACIRVELPESGLAKQLAPYDTCQALGRCAYADAVALLQQQYAAQLVAEEQVRDQRQAW
jgi:hypothetical protein